MQALLSLAFLLPLPFFRPAERTDQAAWGNCSPPSANAG